MDIRKKTIDLLAHERLLFRLPEQHEAFSKVKERVYQLGAGLAGEQEVDCILPEIGLPADAKVLRNITLECIPQHYIQLDTLIVTRKSIILLEIKRYAAGTVEFKEDIGKTVRTSLSQQVDKFDCVIDQVDRATYFLKQVLSSNGIHLPIMPIIVIANSQTAVSLAPKSFPWKYPKQLPRFIRTELNSMADTASSTDAIHRFLLSISYNKPFTPLCQRYNIPTDSLIKGIFCNKCEKLTHLTPGNIACHACRTSKSAAFNDALLDWFLLVDSKLTNRQARGFFNIRSHKQMYYFLATSSEIIKHRNYRYTYYTYKTLQH